jgi:alkylation response protein AidB-like acyl-CoA dehydrogenase
LRHGGEGLLFGAPPQRSQSVRLLLVDFRTRVELAAGLLHRAAWQLDQGEPASRADAAAAKAYVIEALQETAAQATALGVADPDGFVHRMHRDAAAFAAIGGGGEVLRAVIAEATLWPARRPTLVATH